MSHLSTVPPILIDGLYSSIEDPLKVKMNREQISVCICLLTKAEAATIDARYHMNPSDTFQAYLLDLLQRLYHNRTFLKPLSRISSHDQGDRFFTLNFPLYTD
jgi:hypothetical protein